MPAAGRIGIRAEAENGLLLLEIVDNGKGCGEEKLKQLVQESSPHKIGYGIHNVDARIKALYGTSYGLSYAHNAGGG